MTVEAIRLSIINRALSVEKAKHRLAYQPTVSIDDAIQRGVQWYMENKQGSGSGKSGTKRHVSGSQCEEGKL